MPEERKWWRGAHRRSGSRERGWGREQGEQGEEPERGGKKRIRQRGKDRESVCGSHGRRDERGKRPTHVRDGSPDLHHIPII